MLYTLEHLSFVEYDARSKNYAVGPQVLALGYGYLASRDIIDVAMPHLIRLRDRTGWSAHLGELHGRDVVYLARVATRRSIASIVHVGTRLPAHATTMGRILLSGLSDHEIRELYHQELARPLNLSPYAGVAELVSRIAVDRVEGVVVQNSGYEPGVASVAAPIRDVTERIVGAINVSAVALLTDEAELEWPVEGRSDRRSRGDFTRPRTADRPGGGRRQRAELAARPAIRRVVNQHQTVTTGERNG